MAKNISNLDKTLKQNITPADIGAATTSSVTTVSNNIGTLSNLKTSAKGNLVAAINELFQSANSGKQLIANAIGEPLSSNDTFSAMSDKINDIKNDLKQVLENKGADVTEEDDMASLITKVEGLVEGLMELPGFIKQGCWMLAPIATTPHKASSPTITGLGDNLHVMGGGSLDNGYYGVKTHYAYNTKTDTWVELASLPAVRKSSVSITVGDGIYNTGGTGDGYTAQKTTYYYDSNLNSWTTKAAMPGIKKNHAFTSFDNKLFVTGGEEGSGSSYGYKTFIYDILTDTWTQKTDFPANISEHGALTIDSDRIHTFVTSYGQYYIPSTDTWTRANYTTGTGNRRSRGVFSPKTGKAYFANSNNMVSMDFSNIDLVQIAGISMCKLNNVFGDIAEVNGNIYFMYTSGDDATMILGML